MAQADGNIANQSGAQFRADLNNQLLALFTQHSGSAAPVTTYAFQPWVDSSTTPPVYKIRNSANTGWITIGTLDSTFAVGGITPIASGGTGQTTASAAINALVPSQTGNADKFLKTNGTAVSWALAAAGASIQTFSTVGSATYTPTAGKTSFLVFCTGGGGGGGGNGGASTYATGGGAGGTAIRLYNTTEMGANAAVTIGGGGSNSSVTGGTGGSTSFDPAGTGVTITGAGGIGGGNNATVGPGDGGGTTNSLFSINGGGGHFAGTNGGGRGGISFWAGGPGRGGFGTGGGDTTGQLGSAGIVVVLEW